MSSHVLVRKAPSLVVFLPVLSIVAIAPEATVHNSTLDGVIGRCDLKLRPFSFGARPRHSRRGLHLRLALTTNAHRGPRHHLEPFFIDVFAAGNTYAVFTAIQRFHGSLDRPQAGKVTLLQ